MACAAPDLDALPFQPEHIQGALTVFKGSKSSGPSSVPAQLVKHLHPRCIPAVSRFFRTVASTSIPAAWNETRVTPVYKKGDISQAINYRPVSVMGPFAKLYSTCINIELTRQSQQQDWRAPTQAGFRAHHRLEDLAFPLDVLLARALQDGTGLAICFVDLEKAFDTVPRAKMISLLLHHYKVPPSLVEQIRRLYIQTCGQVAGDNCKFNSTTGVRQGCPLSPLLFGLFFDRVVQHVQAHMETTDAVQVTHVLLWAALYADDVALISPSVPGLTRQIQAVDGFCDSELLRISFAKTKVVLVNLQGEVTVVNKADGKIEQVEEFKYLGIDLYGNCSARQKSLKQIATRVAKATTALH